MVTLFGTIVKVFCCIIVPNKYIAIYNPTMNKANDYGDKRTKTALNYHHQLFQQFFRQL